MLEVKIEELTKAVIALTELIGKIEAGKTVQPGIAVEVKPEIVQKMEAGAVVTPVVAAPAAPVAAPVMPAAPTFEPPASVAPAANKAPFTDGKGLITYVMDVYKQLGAEKGAGIQGVLTEMGLTNVNDVRPTEYDTFFAKVEALK